jgi:hypothetical protein
MMADNPKTAGEVTQIPKEKMLSDTININAVHTEFH